MLTISIKKSVKDMCAPYTVNQLLNIARDDSSVFKKFWPSLAKDRSLNIGRKAGAKIKPENREFLKKLKKHIKATYKIFVPYSMLVCVLVKIYRNEIEKKVFSLNVKGYKAETDDFCERLKGIAERIKDELPDIVFLQEFRIGEKEVFLNTLRKELDKFYRFILPNRYGRSDMNHCICISLVGKNISQGRSGRLRYDGAFKLRYNFPALDDHVFINAWMPQIFSATPERQKMAEQMWDSLMASVDHFVKDKVKFCLIGDLNAYAGGPFGDRIRELNDKLVDTKILEDLERPTGEANILDYAFVNRAALYSAVIRTSVESMTDLSDHSALLMRIREI